MTVTTVTPSTYLADTIIMIRDDLLANITDPLVSTRPSTEKFVVTKYPQRGVTYPVVTIDDIGLTEFKRSGMQSLISVFRQGVEIRVWATNVKQRDELSQQIMNRLRLQMQTFSTTNRLHGFRVDGMTNVPMEPGDAAIRSKIINISFMEIMET